MVVKLEAFGSTLLRLALWLATYYLGAVSRLVLQFPYL